jgi:microcin C transport system substrate-binding protein
MRATILAIAAVLVASPLSPSVAQEAVTKSHGISLYGDLRYGPDFTHFDYTNPDAPKGGTFREYTVGTSYDTFNPFALRGVPAIGAGLLYDSLTVRSGDEPESGYGLVAESVELPQDRTWVIYHLRPQARFHDATPITPEDVIWTFNTLREKGRPLYRVYYGDVTKVEQTDEHSVKFTFKDGRNRELADILGEMPVLSKAYFATHDFERASLDPPLSSGPYEVESSEPGRSITYRRVSDYWAADLPVNRGRFNFDQMRFIYYRDRSASLEGFKADDYDVRQDATMRDWMTGYDSPAFSAGLYKKTEIPDQNVSFMQGFGYNTRRPIFQDRRVRDALAFAFDFEWENKTFFFGKYVRTRSYFDNSELAATGLPGPDELQILEKYRGRIPNEVFTEAYEPPKTDGSGNNRDNLKKAIELLQQAGWTIKGEKLVDAEGKPFEFEILLPSDSAFIRITEPFVQSLKRIGITATIRAIDSAQLERRMDSFDFDMAIVAIPQSPSPGNEQRDFWGSAAADTPGSQNQLGVKDPVIDEIVEELIAAPTRESLIAHTRALDRILQFGYYLIPQWHYPFFNVAYWDRFGRPARPPKYDPGYDTWWYDQARADAVVKGKSQLGK